jgi:hypothetical protein
MTIAADTPKLKPGGLVTVAFLKAHLDEGGDHLSIFMPLVLDVVVQFQAQTFTTSDIQEALATTHKLAMPQQAVATLLSGRRTRNIYSVSLGDIVATSTPPFPP